MRYSTSSGRKQKGAYSTEEYTQSRESVFTRWMCMRWVFAAETEAV